MIQGIKAKHTSGTNIWIPNLETKMEKSRSLTSKHLLITTPQLSTGLFNPKSQTMLDKLVNSAVSLYSGQLLQLGSLSFVGFGIEFGLDTIAIFLGLLFSFIGLLISIHSAKVQKQTSKKEEELALLEIQKVKLETEILKQEHPELFTKK
jgi:hypothetical protein